MDLADRSPSLATTPARGAVTALVVLTAMNLVNYLDRWVLPAVLVPVGDEFHLRNWQLGLLGSAFLVVYTVASPVFGRLGDRYARRVLLAIGIALWSLASAATGLAHSFIGLLVARACVGVGEAAYATIAPSLLSDFYPRERRGRAMAWFFVAIPVGTALGYKLGGALGTHVGWRSAFFFTGMPGLLLAGTALLVREPKRGAFDAEPAVEAPGFREALRVLVARGEWVWAVAGYTALTFGLGGLAHWLPTYLQRVRGETLERATGRVGVILAVAGLVGTALGGYLGERSRDPMRGGYLRVCAISAGVAGVAGVLVFRATSLDVMYALLFIASACVFVPSGPLNTVLMNAAPASVRATGSALAIFTIHAFGDAVSPSLIGAVADATELRLAVLLVPASILLAAALWGIGQARAHR